MWCPDDLGRANWVEFVACPPNAWCSWTTWFVNCYQYYFSTSSKISLYICNYHLICSLEAVMEAHYPEHVREFGVPCAHSTDALGGGADPAGHLPEHLRRERVWAPQI